MPGPTLHVQLKEAVYNYLKAVSKQYAENDDNRYETIANTSRVTDDLTKLLGVTLTSEQIQNIVEKGATEVPLGKVLTEQDGIEKTLASLTKVELREHIEQCANEISESWLNRFTLGYVGGSTLKQELTKVLDDVSVEQAQQMDEKVPNHVVNEVKENESGNSQTEFSNKTTFKKDDSENERREQQQPSQKYSPTSKPRLIASNFQRKQGKTYAIVLENQKPVPHHEKRPSEKKHAHAHKAKVG